MRKVACWVLILFMVVFLINPLPSAARGGHGGPPPPGPGGVPNGWWIPWAVIGSVIVLSSLYSNYSSILNETRTVVIREENPMYVQPVATVTPSSTKKLFVYPRQGQSEEQQAKDRYECHSWAVRQAQYDPTQVTTDTPDYQLNQIRADYQRAMGACFDGRGYNMK